MRAWTYLLKLGLGYGCLAGCSEARIKSTDLDSGASKPVGVNIEDIHWRPSALYPGVEVGDLEGGSDEGPYTLRGRFPAGAVERPHWHPNMAT